LAIHREFIGVCDIGDKATVEQRAIKGGIHEDHRRTVVSSRVGFSHTKRENVAVKGKRKHTSGYEEGVQ
jgi:hypothetical protein